MCSGRQSRPHLFHVVRKVCTKSGHVSTIPPVVKNNSHHGISTIKSDYPFDIWDLANDPYEAKQMLEAWRSSIPEKQLDIWADLVKASRNWEDEILNYFATGKEVTNALTESLNRKIRDKNRDGRGYSFDVLRGKILFSTPHKTRRVTNRSSPFKSNTTKFMKNFSFSDLLQRTELEEDIIIDYGVDLSTI